MSRSSSEEKATVSAALTRQPTVFRVLPARRDALAHHLIRQSSLRQLSLVDLLVDRVRREQAVDVDLFLLAVTAMSDRHPRTATHR